MCVLLSIWTNSGVGCLFFSPHSAAICISLSNFTTQILKLLFLAMVSIKLDREPPPVAHTRAQITDVRAVAAQQKTQIQDPSGLYGLNLLLTANAAEASRHRGSILWVIISEKCGLNGGWRWRLGLGRVGGGARAGE